MKPSWNDAPEWAQYLAKDRSGVWWWYECEPLYDDDSGNWEPMSSMYVQATNIPSYESLSKRPETEPETSV